MENPIPPLGYRSRYPAWVTAPTQSGKFKRVFDSVMSERGYKLLDTPADLRASIDTLVQNYELVRQNIAEIVPSLPPSCSVVVLAGDTPHNARKIPLLGLHIPDEVSDLDFLDVQEEIDNWFESIPPEKIDEMRRDVKHPSWQTVLECGIYPNEP